jgi:hypothetical protein
MTSTDAHLEAQIREIRTALIGLDGKNGLRGELRAFIDRYDQRDGDVKAWQKSVEDRWNTYLQIERQTTCYGAAKLDEYIKQDEKRREDRRKTDITAIEYKKAIVVAFIASFSSIFVAILSLFVRK